MNNASNNARNVALLELARATHFVGVKRVASSDHRAKRRAQVLRSLDLELLNCRFATL